PKSVKQIMELVVMVRDNVTVVPDDMWRMSVRFIDPEFRSLSAEADAVTKIGSAMPSLVDQPVLLERIFTADEVERIRVDGQKSSVASLVNRIANAQAVPQNVADAQQ